MFYLGFDASTQSLTAILIAVDGASQAVVAEHTFHYDEALPHYGTTHGVLHGAAAGVVVAPPLMWAEALDLMMATLARAHPREVASIAAIAGSAQQHGSVYLSDRAATAIGSLDAREPLAAQLGGIFSRAVAPVWMDSSTTTECREIADAVGGAGVLAAHTGSRAFERFTGPQIRRFYKTEPEAYGATKRIHLVSSFLASLLAGSDAPLDPADASGMNLMELASSAWWPAALAATAPDLASKLPSIVAAPTVIGRLAPYWRHRYGFGDARVVVWSGDNPSSLVGTGLVREGHVAVSLGTSDTVFGVMREPRIDPSGSGHVFRAPVGHFMGMTVFANGSLARERVRDAYGLDWAKFSDALRTTPPGNDGGVMLPWFDPEITPRVAVAGVHRFGLDGSSGAREIRAVVEAQMMAMANHSRWMGVAIDTIHATGGASANREILQIMADVFGANVSPLATGNSACLGAALRACEADWRADGRPAAWDDVIQGFVEPRADARITPDAARTTLYSALRRRYSAFEDEALRSGSP